MYLLGGENLYQSTHQLEELKQEYIKKGYRVSVFDATDDVEAERSIREADSFDLFEQKRCIILKRLLSGKIQLIEKVYGYLKKKPKIELILWEDKPIDKRKGLYKFIKESGRFEEFKKLNFPQLKTWILGFLRGKTEIENLAIDKLIFKIGDDQMQLASTLENLITFVQIEKREVIKAEDVERLIEKSTEESIWEFIDALGMCNKAKALSLMENLIRERDDFSRIIAMIGRQFRILVMIKYLLSVGKTYADIVSELALHPFVVRKGVEQSKNFSLPRLRKLYQKLVNTDEVVKEGKFDGKLAIDLLILAL
jgi:DNA polymerase-3 subunit delta